VCAGQAIGVVSPRCRRLKGWIFAPQRDLISQVSMGTIGHAATGTHSSKDLTPARSPAWRQDFTPFTLSCARLLDILAIYDAEVVRDRMAFLEDSREVAHLLFAHRLEQLNAEFVGHYL
jgi:hypothetical protein